MPDDRIVEVYSAADVVEAHALCDLLQEEAIQARVVGGALANAAGWIPAAEAAPRIWVHETDQSRARQIIDAYLNELRVEMVEPEDGELQEETAEPADAEEQRPTSAEDSRAMATGLTVIGVACIVLGALHAAYRWMTVGQYSATTQGVLAVYAPVGYRVESTSRDLPIPGRVTLHTVLDARYVYTVEGVKYPAMLRGRYGVADRVTIHYDPAHPADCIAGSLAAPWLSLVLGGAIGVCFLFVAFRFR